MDSDYLLDDEGYVVIRFVGRKPDLGNSLKSSTANAVTKTQSIKVKHLRKTYGPDMDLKKWLEDPNHIYTGRNGRIFIDGEIFHYPKSKWANPNVMEKGKKPTKKDYEENFKKYISHLRKSGLLSKEHLDELRGKTLGCFCDTASTTDASCMDCHTKVLLGLLKSEK